MEITFQCPTTESKTVEIPEESLPKLYGAIRDCFIHRMQTFGLPDFSKFESEEGDSPLYSFESDLIEVCKDCGINWSNRFEVVAFFSSLLIAANGEQNECCDDFDDTEGKTESGDPSDS